VLEEILSQKRLLRLHELPKSLPDSLTSVGSNPLDKIPPSVCYIEVEEENGDAGSGSGFVISPDGKLLTSYHVVENARAICARFDHCPTQRFRADFLDGDKESDIAVLKLEGDSFPYALIAPYGDRVLRGENVGLLGYPLGEDFAGTVTYTASVTSNFRQQPNGVNLLQFDANAYHGNSGGPLFRLTDGCVLGILMGGWKEAKQINFAVSINELYKRLISEY